MLLQSNEKAGFVPRVNADIVEEYRKHMIAMFGNTKLPAVIYKGEYIPERSL